jgi:hypothetical protein
MVGGGKARDYMQTGVPERTPVRHYRLLPHERWLARWGARGRARSRALRGDPPPGGSRWAIEQNYGPVGDILGPAYVGDLCGGLLVGLLGAILLGVSLAQGTLGTAGGCIFLLGIVLVLLGIVRAVQLSHAGKAFRAGRPRVRPTRPGPTF